MDGWMVWSAAYLQYLRGGVGGTCGEKECDVQVGIWLYVGTLLYVAVIYS